MKVLISLLFLDIRGGYKYGMERNISKRRDEKTK